MVRSFLLSVVLAGVSLVVCGCSGGPPKYSTYVKPEVDFDRFSHYRWQEAKPETTLLQAENDIVHRLIVQTTEEELAADGLEKAAAADLIVTYRMTVSPQKSFWQSFFAAESATPGSYNLRSSEAQTSAVEEKTLKQGVLVIEMRNPAGDIVWSGRASAVFSEAQPGSAVAAVRKILADFPPGR